ncbi:MAG: hypothetical protein DRI24_21485 [Deltaproteobacteria bacterium]|nr:MAG: hypothetical protein DRI24_21485 [Deltaproteobacteria bacterium]
MARRLLSKGYHRVYVLKGGWDAWLISNFPVEEKSPLLN